MKNISVTKYDVEQYKRDFLDSTVLVSSRVATQVLSRSARSLNQLVEDGKITAYAEGKASCGRRYLASELRSYVESLRVDVEEFRR